MLRHGQQLTFLNKTAVCLNENAKAFDNKGSVDENQSNNINVT